MMDRMTVAGVLGAKCFAIGLAASMVSGAAAESVGFVAETPAGNRAVAMLDSLAIGRLGGGDGMRLAMAIERALAQPGPDGQPHFDLMAGRRGGGADADGVLDGAVISEVQENRVKLERNRCIEGSDKDCKKRGNVELDCRRRVLSVRADLRVVGNADGRILYAEQHPRREEVSWCPGDTSPVGVEDRVSAMIDTIAAEVRDDLTPRAERVNIRFREGRKGMDKAAGERFKQAIRLTQRDLRAACGEFDAIEAAMPGHPSVVFNRALCAEAADSLEQARTIYAAASAIEPRASDIREALSRVEATMTARADAAERRAARGG
ncbi:hypothetical protein OKW76_09035 [Sphingomonas sp. S1-29]|uniref:hypothetical protein n=1 Tax=Sphingomonas sp. S1-29 TaxID=2991074 RepID=UPI00223F4CD5|nr:hypothetical protein [Sphingomonas sp. S1-29]UZK68218.1 hypothetical protein OKW76_09035 [Sphingomonas sp. S1-29]